MDEVFKRILDKLAGADFWIALGFLAAGYICWRWDRHDDHRQEKGAAQADWIKKAFWR
jgi:hypothetical protein